MTSSKKKVVEEVVTSSKKKVVEEAVTSGKKRVVEEVLDSGKKKVEGRSASREVMKEAAVQVAEAKPKETPVYTSEDEQPVKVKFFVVEMFESIFR